MAPLAVLVPVFSIPAAAATTYAVTSTIPVAQEQGGGSIAVDSPTQRAYVTSYDGNSVTVINTANNTVVTSIAVGSHPNGVAIDTLPNHVIAGMAQANAVNRPAIVPPPVVQTAPTVFVGNFGGQSISVIDSSTNQVVATVQIPHNSPMALAVDPTSHTLYAAGTADNVPNAGYASTIDEVHRTWTSSTGTTGVYQHAAIDTSSHKLFVTGCCLDKMWTFQFPATSSAPIPGTGGVAVNSTTHMAYVANESTTAGAVSVVDGSTNAISATVPVGSKPDGIAVDASANTVYVSNGPDGTVSIINAATNTVTATVPVGTSPDAIAVDAATHTAYVLNRGSNTVSVITRTVTGPVTRLAGSDRFATAVEISKAKFPTGNAGAVVLARSDDYPDALVGAPLAAAKNAPLLLTSGTSLPAATKAEIQRVLPSGRPVYVLGGPNAVPTSIDTELTGLGYTVTRYFGATRYATAVKVADALGDPGTVLLATGTNFPDALSAGVAAVKAGGVVLLTSGGALPSETAVYLSAHPGTVYAVGGPAATADPSATAIVGADRFETAVDVATKFFTGSATIGFATGLSFPDALSGGALLGPAGGPLLLVSTSSVPSSVTNYLALTHATITQGYLFGGPNTVSASVADSLNIALGG